MMKLRIMRTMSAGLAGVVCLAAVGWPFNVARAADQDYLPDGSDFLGPQMLLPESSRLLNPAAIEPFHAWPHRDFAEAAALLRQGQFRQALELLDKSSADGLSEDVGAEYWYLRGNALLALKDYTAAGLCFMRVVVFYSDSSHYGMALYRLAEVHERLQRFDVAYDLYRQVSQLPSSAYNSEPRGRATKRLGKFEAVFGKSLALCRLS